MLLVRLVCVIQSVIGLLGLAVIDDSKYSKTLQGFILTFKLEGKNKEKKETKDTVLF